MTGYTALVRLSIHQNDIRADPADTVPGDHIIVPSAPKTEHPAGTGNGDGHKLPLRQLHTGIADKAQPLSVADTNNLFTVQVR